MTQHGDGYPGPADETGGGTSGTEAGWQDAGWDDGGDWPGDDG